MTEQLELMVSKTEILPKPNRFSLEGDYNPDEDIRNSGGKDGINKAAKMLDEESIKYFEHESDMVYFQKLVEIVKTGGINTTHSQRKKIFSVLGIKGYDLIPYSRMNSQESLKYFSEVREDIFGILRELREQESFKGYVESNPSF